MTALANPIYPQERAMPEFKSWLISTLEPMCDADPVVMSDYIIALLEHEAVMSEEQWIQFISRELTDFLEDQSRPFAELLFKTLREKSFVAAPADADVSDAAAGPSSSAAPAIVSSYRPSAPANAPTGPSADAAGPSGPSLGVSGGEGMDVDGSAAPGPSQQNRRNGQPRRKCRDYHEKGYCMRGAACQFEHSDDMIIPTPEMMFAQMPFMGGQQQQRRRGGGRGAGRGGRGGRGGGMNGHGGPGFPQAPFPFMGFPMQFPPSQLNGNNNDARANFWGINKPPTDRNGDTLVITDIPRSSLSVPVIRDYFAQFGEVTNVALEKGSSRALVSFETNREAYKAWKSDDAVFGSRHVKVLWHRPRPGHGEAGKQALEKSADLVARLKAMEEANGVTQEKKAILSGPESRLAATLAELDARERRGKKETLMAEQKVLLKRASEGSKEEKISMLKRMKEITKEIEELDNPPPAPKGGENGEGAEDVDMDDRTKLDRELAKHGMETKAQGDQAELMKLSSQLSALRDKANALGIPASTAARYSPYSRGGRGRGRGRGGPPKPMRLDNRTRALMLAGDALQGDQAQSVREYFESTGGVLEPVDGGVKVGYPNREMAEKVLAMGTKDIPNFTGNLNATWYTSAPSATPTTRASNEVEMVEESQRGDKDEED